MNNQQQLDKIPNGNPLIYGMKATPEINHNMGMSLKSFTQKRWLHLYPISVDENRSVDLTSEEERLIMEAEETRIEVLNIKNKPSDSGQYVKFYSTSRRKDRWSALCMGLYGSQILFKERHEDTVEFYVGVSKR